VPAENAETLALLKIIELGTKQVEQGKVRNAREAIAELRALIREPR